MKFKIRHWVLPKIYIFCVMIVKKNQKQSITIMVQNVPFVNHIIQLNYDVSENNNFLKQYKLLPKHVLCL